MESSIALVRACPKCRLPVTLGGGMTMMNFLSSGRLAARLASASTDQKGQTLLTAEARSFPPFTPSSLNSVRRISSGHRLRKIYSSLLIKSNTLLLALRGLVDKYRLLSLGLFGLGLLLGLLLISSSITSLQTPLSPLVNNEYCVQPSSSPPCSS